jgi:hypothetical protein
MESTEVPSGLLRLRGSLGDPAPEQFEKAIRAIHALGPLYAIADFSRLSIPVPEELASRNQALFDWLADAAIGSSPWLTAIHKFPDWPAYLDTALGSDAMVVVMSDLQEDELVELLRNKLTDSSPGPSGSRGILGFCWPSVLQSLLEVNAEGFVDDFFEQIGLVIIEVTGQSDAWQVYGRKPAIEQVTKLGITIKT